MKKNDTLNIRIFFSVIVSFTLFDIFILKSRYLDCIYYLGIHIYISKYRIINFKTISRKKEIDKMGGRKRRRCRFIQGHHFGRRFFALRTK